MAAEDAHILAPPGTQSPKVTIAPHRAIYDMTLASVRNGSNISDVSGKMLFEWTDVCDGWAIQQHLKMHFNYAEGEDSEVSSTELSWESKDGTHFKFNVHRVTDGKENEVYRGTATSDTTGNADYTAPDAHKTVLPPGTLFPSAHTIQIIQKAESNEKFFTRRVFDGADKDGMSDVSVFIDPTDTKPVDVKLSDDIKNNPLLGQPAWPVRMAFFKPDSETGEPDYEMDLGLSANGVAKYMRIDYGDFAVLGTLSAIEPLPPCAQ
ncbi:MAG: cell envelope integrity EipB family protein [Alphaproteobacteria bacterium]|nr:cell envelope integrity EipB family protein [Alphaproteobacteria bacterium]MBV8547943.1 cell envelope integrity EipB family protein [Alphaproteobacteria bacterium]